MAGAGMKLLALMIILASSSACCRAKKHWYTKRYHIFLKNDLDVDLFTSCKSKEEDYGEQTLKAGETREFWADYDVIFGLSRHWCYIRQPNGDWIRWDIVSPRTISSFISAAGYIEYSCPHRECRWSVQKDRLHYWSFKWDKWNHAK